MNRGISRRLGVLLLVGSVVVGVIAAIALAASERTTAQGAGAGAMQLSLAGSPPFAITSYDFEIEANSSWTKGSGASVGKPSPGGFRFTKVVDANTDEAITKVASGKSYAKGELSVSWGTGDKLVIAMTEMFVVRVQQAGEGGRPVETIEVVYKTISWQLGATSGVWDVPQGKVT